MSLDYPGRPRWNPRVSMRKRQAGQHLRKDEVATSQEVQEFLEVGKGKKTPPPGASRRNSALLAP